MLCFTKEIIWREEKSYFQDVINPKGLFSVLAVKPKLTSQRIQSPKGAFLLYGLNVEDYTKNLPLITEQLELNADTDYHPVVRMTKIHIAPSLTLQHMEKIGITRPYIYP